MKEIKLYNNTHQNIALISIIHIRVIRALFNPIPKINHGEFCHKPFSHSASSWTLQSRRPELVSVSLRRLIPFRTQDFTASSLKLFSIKREIQSRGFVWLGRSYILNWSQKSVTWDPWGALIVKFGHKSLKYLWPDGYKFFNHTEMFGFWTLKPL